MKWNGTHSAVSIRIMTLFHAGWQGTRRELSEAVFSHKQHIDRVILELRGCGLVRVVGWKKRPAGRGGSPFAVYGLGDGSPDESPPKVVKTPVALISRSANTQQVLEWIKESPLTMQQIVARLGKPDERWGYRYIKPLRTENLIHVKRWVRGESGFMAQEFHFGPGIDAPKPQPMSNKEKKRRRRQKLIEKFGTNVAWRIYMSRNEGGVDRLVRDGVTVYQRKKG